LNVEAFHGLCRLSDLHFDLTAVETGSSLLQTSAQMLQVVNIYQVHVHYVGFLQSAA
jgi:hypothetical protein